MYISIASNGNTVSEHFGSCEGFTIYRIENMSVIKKSFIYNPGHKPGAIPILLHKQGIDIVITGNMGVRAQKLFKDADMCIVTGAEGNVDNIINKYIKGELKSTKTVCTQHRMGSCS